MQTIPPLEVQENASKGLRLRKQYGRGGTHIGVERARKLISGDPLDPEDIKRMVSYFARHECDKRAKNFGNEDNPSAGYIAWLLWGGEEGKFWANRLKGKKKSTRKQHRELKELLKQSGFWI